MKGHIAKLLSETLISQPLNASSILAIIESCRNAGVKPGNDFKVKKSFWALLAIYIPFLG
jgi:hypothetical protein